MEFKEFEPRFKSAKTRFKLSTGLNLETLDTIFSGTNLFKPWLKFKPPLKFFKFGHWLTLIGDGLNLDRYVSRTCYGVGVYYILTSLRSAYLFAYLPTSLQSYLSPYLPTYLPPYLPASQPILKLSTYLSTYKKWKNRVNKVKNLLFWNKIFFVIACYWKQKIYKCKLYFNNS